MPQASSDTYTTERVRLLRELSSRAGNTFDKDEDFLNVILEIVKDKNAGDKRDFVFKRPGASQMIASQVGAEVRGMIYWEDQKKLIYAADVNIYVYDILASSLTTLSSVFTTNSGEVGFTQYLYDTNQVVIMASDGQKLVSISSTNTVTTCTDPDLPTPHLPTIVFLDGYLFVSKEGTSDIYNSDLNDPMAWTSGNFITAEMQPDYVVRLCKINNYVCVFGTDSIEYFFDAGNASGSPLQRNESPIKLNSYLGSFAQYGNDIFYVGRNYAGQPDVFKLSNFKMENIGSPIITRYLTTTVEPSTVWVAGILATQGHILYMVSANDYTYAYDLEEKLWTRWAYQQNLGFLLNNCVAVNSTTIHKSYFSLRGVTSAIYSLDETAYTDDGSLYTARIVTEQSSFGTLNRKKMHRVSIIGDRPATTANVLVYWSDDDYQTYAGPLTVNMDQDLPCAYRLGAFRQRAFKLMYTGSQPWRIQELEVNINKGIS